MDDLANHFLDHPEDLALAVTAAILLGLCLWSLRGLLVLRRELRGRPGYSVTTLLSVVAGAVTVGQALSLLAAVLIVWDRDGTIEYRVWIYIAADALEVGGLLYGVRQVKRIANGQHGEPPRRRRGD